MSESYDHTQRGWLHHLILFVGVLPCVAGAAVLLVHSDMSFGPLSVFITLLGTAVLCAAMTPCFVYLRVRDRGNWLEVRFGPWGIFNTRVDYRDVESAQPGRTCLLDGLGVHGWPWRHVVYNIRGRRCVVATFKKPKGLLRFRKIKIGTDEPEALAAFLASRIKRPP